MREKLIKVHAVSATLALLLISTFFVSTSISEVVGDYDDIKTVKTIIFYLIWVVIPLMGVAGITGNKLAPKAHGGIIGRKKRRMPFVAANGVLVLVPCAIYLKTLAVTGSFDSTFYIVQCVELIAGFLNITLMSLNMRDGLSIRNVKVRSSVKDK
ncbi:hypothetical protein J8M20_08565 [Pseudoalteromonas luteoviolacea]|uniref:hypothetical protein n=1 Tax=Pseudoalteromonas luteoviolacea TaxID=43657 RepID=UPI001B3951D3|nr:hypothetical protein [Pseudoalteromonas luteoviolacea]MBQ4811387.1 hypothetical protein [Pseudoalteromonas luteoviolacea]